MRANGSTEKKIIENAEYIKFARRIMRGMAKRIGGQGYVEDLGEMLALQNELNEQIQRTVDSLREQGFSWAEIATYTGASRQAAQQRWGKKK